MTYSAFRERRSPEMLFCIVMWLLSLWWGGKVGWQLFFKTWALAPQWFFSGFFVAFPIPYLQTTVFFPATIFSVHLISSEAGNQIMFNYKVIKGHLKSCLSKPARAQQHGSPVCNITLNPVAKRCKNQKRDQEDLFNWQSCKTEPLPKGEESLLVLFKMNSISFSVRGDYMRNIGERKTFRSSPRADSFSQLLAWIQNSPCQIITRTFSQK